MHRLGGNIDIHSPWSAPAPTAFASVRLGNFLAGISNLKLEGDTCRELSDAEKIDKELFTVNLLKSWLHLYDIPSFAVSTLDLE